MRRVIYSLLKVSYDRINLEWSLSALSGSDDDPAYNILPMIVRELCEFEDDPNMPVLTWRSVLSES